MTDNIKQPFGTPSQGSILTEEHKQYAKNIRINSRIALGNQKTMHDTKTLSTVDDTWSIRHGGKTHKLHFECIESAELKTIFKQVSVSFLRLHDPAYAARGLGFAKKVFVEELSFEVAEKALVTIAEKETESPVDYYAFKRFVRLLIEKGCPGFDYDDLFKLDNLPRPQTDNWASYYRLEILIKAPERNMIQRGILSASSRIKSLTFNELHDTCILALLYVAGCRPVQAIQLEHSSVQQKANSHFYTITIPFAKQRKVTMQPYTLQLPSEVAVLLNELKSRHHQGTSQLLGFEDADILSVSFFQSAINRQMLSFASVDAQEAFKTGEAEQPLYTPTDFRHNVGHQMAMSGASADEIAYVLGHSSLVAARHYIAATPELAMIKARTLGRNKAYTDMIGMIMTGSIVDEERWKGRKILGIVGMTLCSGIGGCAAGITCPFSPVRSCYGCLDFNPFSDGNHEHVLQEVQDEAQMMYDLSESTGCVKRNPLLDVSEQTVFEVESIIARCKLYNGEDK